MQTYQEVENHFLRQVAGFSPNQLVKIGDWIIKQIIPKIPNNFADDTLAEEKPLLMALHDEFLKITWQPKTIEQILAKLDDIVQDYGDDYPADMDYLPMSLIKFASFYRNIRDTIEQDIDDKPSINADTIWFILKYLDFLDYEQSEMGQIDDTKWASYPVIAQGVTELQNFLFTLG